MYAIKVSEMYVHNHGTGQVLLFIVCMDPCLEHHRKFTDSAGSLLGLRCLLGQGHGSKFLSCHFQKVSVGGPPDLPPPDPHQHDQAFVAPELGFT